VRASTLFAATIAILTGLGVVAAAKYSGFFAPHETPPPPKPEPIMVLVAKKNLFEGMTVVADDVRVRALKADELDAYNSHKADYLPPLTAAAALRILAKSVEADRPLTRDLFKDQTIPDPLDSRLDPGTRAVNVAVTKNRSAGGLIQVGERVDVFLTADITQGDDTTKGSTTQTACIARNLKVIIKHNSLWPMLSTIPADRPVNFTLEANPYRAALIEFAQTKGDLSLALTPNPRQLVIEPRDRTATPTFSDPDSKEYKDEDLRVAALNSGDLTVGNQDLERIFNLKPPPPKTPPITVERYTGLQYQGTTVFAPEGRLDVPAGKANGPGAMTPPPDKSGVGYHFTAPSEVSSDESKKDCPTCGKNKKKP
jgi:Flp pilus assembly protein CpaB